MESARCERDSWDMSTTTLSRPREGRMIAGVCAGLARRFGLDPTLVRVLFVLSTLLPGPQVLAYIILWIVMPSEKRI
jgi:phage shock protein C